MPACSRLASRPTETSMTTTGIFLCLAYHSTLAPGTRPALHRSHTQQRQTAETVKFHVIRIFTQPDANGRARAVPRAQRYGLLSGPFRGLHLTTHCAVA